MSLLKKLKGLLVDVESGTDDDEESITLSQGEVSSYSASTPLDDLIKPRVLDENRREILEHTEIEVKEEKKVSSFVDISADVEPGKDQKVKTHRVREISRESTRESNRESREEEFGLRDDPYETVDVISPLYGLVDEEKEQVESKPVKAVKTSKVSGVISPMFGKINNTASNVIKPVSKKVESKQEPETKLDSFRASDVLAVMDADEDEGILLSSMISKDSEETLDETTQISLFGDHVSVHKQEQDLFELQEDESSKEVSITNEVEEKE